MMTKFVNSKLEISPHLFTGDSGVHFRTILLIVVSIFNAKYQDKIFKTSDIYNFKPYKHFITASQIFFVLITGYCGFKITGSKEKITTNCLPKFLTAFVTLLSLILSNSSLEYLNYTTYVTIKGSKPVFICIIGFIIFGLRYKMKKIAVCLVIAFCVTLFSLDESSRSKISNVTHKSENNLMKGLMFIIISMISEGFMSGLQEYIRRSEKPSLFHWMIVLNFWSFLFILAFALKKGVIIPGIKIISQNPYALKDFILFNISNILVQFIIFSFVTKYDSIVITTATSLKRIGVLAFMSIFVGPMMSKIQIFLSFAIIVVLFVEGFYSTAPVKTIKRE